MGRMEESLISVKENLASVQEDLTSVQDSVEASTMLSLSSLNETLLQSRKLFNPWQIEFLTGKSESKRGSSWRSDCLSHYRIPILRREVDAKGNTRKFVACTITGIVGDGQQIPAAHLIPRKAPGNIRRRIGLNLEDLHNPRNSLVICKGLETAYDEMKLSFLETPVGTWCIKVWDTSILGLNLHSESLSTIGDFTDVQFSIDPSPYKTALFYQAYVAYHNALERDWISADDVVEPYLCSTPERKGEFMKLYDSVKKVKETACGDFNHDIVAKIMRDDERT
jgi:hypothetical protein